jgi:flavin-dependent dehydrogenase
MQRSSTIDALVIGGGPAGCAAAIALARKGALVTLIDRGPSKKQRIGESLPPAAKRELLRLALYERFRIDSHRPSYGVRSIWGSAVSHFNDFVFQPGGVGWHIDRARFDRMMLDAALAAGARVHCGMRPIGYRATLAGWEAEVEAGRRRVRIATHVLVDASGRAASVARRVHANPIALDRLIGIARFYDTRGGLADESFTLLEATPLGWWYSTFLPDDRLVAVYFTDPDLTRCAEPPCHTRDRLKGGKAMSETIVCAAHSTRLDRPAGRAWIAVGDTASAWDPLSSQGIVEALRSGASAAASVVDYLSKDTMALERYAANAESRFERYRLAYRKHYQREMRWPQATFWRRRHAGLPAISKPTQRSRGTDEQRTTNTH